MCTIYHLRLNAMSKVISFSISDRYLDKLRSLYPELTENLAAKQFLIDQLDAGLDDNLDNDLDDKLKILIEKSLEDRLDAKLDDRLNAMGKSIKDLANKLSQWASAFDNQLKDIGQEIKDKSITLDHQIKAIEARLDESLDKVLDESLDESSDNTLYESYNEIFIDKPDESLDTSLDDGPVTLEEILLQKKAIREEWQTLKEILGQRRKDWPKSIEGLRKKAIREGWPRRDRENRKEYQIPVGK